MTTKPSRKLPEVFILIISQVIRIRIHFSKREVVVVCRPRKGMRIFVSIIPQVIQWEVLVLVVVVRDKDIDIQANYGIIATTVMPRAVI